MNRSRPRFFSISFSTLLAILAVVGSLFFYGYSQNWQFLSLSVSQERDLSWEDFVALLDRCEIGSSKFEYCKTALKVVIQDLKMNPKMKKEKLTNLSRVQSTADLKVFARHLKRRLEPQREKYWTIKALNSWLKRIDPFSSVSDEATLVVNEDSLSMSRSASARASLKLKDLSSSKLCAEVEAYVRELEADPEVKSVRIDLRGNPGGLVDQALCIGNLFVEKGELLMQLRRKKIDWPFEVESSWLLGALDFFHEEVLSRYAENPRVFSKKVEVWIDHKSASAAEVLASILQDKAGAVVKGEKSFGKSVVQLPRQLKNERGIVAHLTAFEWLRPSAAYAAENSYTGVEPD